MVSFLKNFLKNFYEAQIFPEKFDKALLLYNTFLYNNQIALDKKLNQNFSRAMKKYILSSNFYE